MAALTPNRAILVLAALFMLPFAGFAAGTDLPELAPRPSASPEAPPIEEAVPVPQARPEESDKTTSAPQTDARTPDLSAAVPPEELACRVRLRALGVAFAEHDPLSDEAGCVVPHPITLKSLGSGIALEPEAVINCAMAEAAASFASETIAPAARAQLGADLKTLHHASAYVCRPRNGDTKLSEHAFGNALDIGALTLSDGRTIAVAATTNAADARFLSEIRMAACGPFKTVLGPGSNADHELHFHFDLAQRRNGSTYCR